MNACVACMLVNVSHACLIIMPDAQGHSGFCGVDKVRSQSAMEKMSNSFLDKQHKLGMPCRRSDSPGNCTIVIRA